jgi:hypothetical protein
MLEAQTVPVLKAICSKWGLRPEKSKALLVSTMTDWLSTGDNVRQLAGAAPDRIRAEIVRLAWEGPITGALQTPAVTWALGHGLMYSVYWNAAEMPGEVGSALRGPDWRPVFTPRPPEPATVTVSPEMVKRESASAAMAVLEQMGALTAECARKPAQALKSGGIGVREQRRLAKVAGCDEASVRLWLEIAFEAALLELEGEYRGDEQLLATAEYDNWLGKEPAARLTQLLHAWRRLGTEPYADAEPESGLAILARQELLTAAGRLPRDKGLVAAEGLLPVLAWQVPGLVLTPGSLTGLWREAMAMGIVAHGALTPLGCALVVDDEDGLVEAARDLVGTPTTSAIFQADLTAIVPGIPDHALAGLLDSAADRESKGGALIWRFSGASVRRALDSGVTPDELTARLSAVSGGGVIPQPLAYLIGDIGRQHGRVRVRAIGCVIHGVEEALLTEVMTAKALRKLGLTRLAPTVLASASNQEETLAALRAAGYFPAAEEPDGKPQAPQASQQRAGAQAPRPDFGVSLFLAGSAGAPAQGEDPYALAERLCARPPGKELTGLPAILGGLPFDVANQLGGFAGFPGLDDDGDDRGVVPEEHELLHLVIEEYADTLDPDSVCALAMAIESSDPVRVTYRPIGSRIKQRTVFLPESVAGEYLRGRGITDGQPVKLRLADLEGVRPM